VDLYKSSGGLKNCDLAGMIPKMKIKKVPACTSRDYYSTPKPKTTEIIKIG